jgi:hypothetical protein
MPHAVAHARDGPDLSQTLAVFVASKSRPGLSAGRFSRHRIFLRAAASRSVYDFRRIDIDLPRSCIGVGARKAAVSLGDVPFLGEFTVW